MWMIIRSVVAVMILSPLVAVTPGVVVVVAVKPAAAADAGGAGGGAAG